MADARANALKKKEELEAQIANLKLDLSKIEQFLSMYSEFENNERTKSEKREMRYSAIPKVKISVHRRKRKLTPDNIVKMMENIIRDFGAPIPSSGLIDGLEVRKIKIPSDNKSAYISNLLWRHKDRFINLKGFGYWTKDKPFFEANYIPESILKEAAKMPPPGPIRD
jgi:hypothetical protein